MRQERPRGLACHPRSSRLQQQGSLVRAHLLSRQDSLAIRTRYALVEPYRLCVDAMGRAAMNSRQSADY
jgi:hypothetical protein